jgi:hypothetical protein
VEHIVKIEENVKMSKIGKRNYKSLKGFWKFEMKLKNNKIKKKICILFVIKLRKIEKNSNNVQ